MIDRFTFLRQVPLFDGLNDHDLQLLCQDAAELALQPGDLLFAEGSPGDRAYVIAAGQVEVYKTVNRRRVPLGVRGPGEMVGELAMLAAAPRLASGVALNACTLLALDATLFGRLLRTAPGAAEAILRTISQRLLSTQALLQQNERLAQLGMFAAGMAHEINNPAAAVQRSAGQLEETLGRFAQLQARLPAQLQPAMQALEAAAIQARPPAGDLLARSDQERQLEAWLEGWGIAAAWDLAPQLAEAGLQAAQLEPALQLAPPAQRETLLQWVCAGAALRRLAAEIAQGAGRITEIVTALKSYVHLDQSPMQEVDLHASLDDTLAVLGHRLEAGIRVRREYDPALPPVLAYGRELNQVWTHLVENAIDAVGSGGQITLRTAWRDPWAVVDVADDGPGLSAEAREHLFSPFFTTKPVGQGAGLGLHLSYNIVQKHGGEIRVRSKPGETHVEVWLPRDFEQARRAGLSYPSPGAYLL